MNTTRHSFAIGNVIAENCRIMKGPDNKLGVLVPIADLELASHETENASNESAYRDGTYRPISDPTAPPSSPANDWSTREDGNVWKMIWKPDPRTQITLMDHGDGFADVLRRHKPRHGKSIKDTPMREKPLMECLTQIEKWISVIPDTWTRCDEPNSKVTTSQRRKRCKVRDMRNKLFRR